MTVEEIVRNLINGEDVYLEDIYYDFTGYHSIPVSSKIVGKNSTIICDDFYQTGVDGMENAQVGFLFHAFDGSSFENLNIFGPNGSIGSTDYSKLWGAINILESTNIKNCRFEDCDKWAIRVENKGPVMKTSYIEDCIFRNIKRQGYGYAIWNQYGDARVRGCKFFNCRHGIDISSKRACYTIRNCEFDQSNYIHINMHGYGNGITCGDKISIGNCRFYDNMQPLQLKMPYTETGFVEIVNCDFLVSEDKVGVVDSPARVPIKGFKHPQFTFKGNIFNGADLLPAPVIDGPSEVNINELYTLSTLTYSDDQCDFYWNQPIFKGVSKAQGLKIYPEVTSIYLYAVDKNTGKRSIAGRKTIIIKDSTESEGYFTFQYSGLDSQIEVLKNGEVIDTVEVNSNNWYSKLYKGDGKYELRLIGTGYVLLDNWLEVNSRRTFFTTLDDEIKLKASYNNNTTVIKLGLIKGESFSGTGCLKVTLSGTGNLTLKNNVDK